MMKEYCELAYNTDFENAWALGELRGEGDDDLLYWKYGKPNEISSVSDSLYIDLDLPGIPTDYYVVYPNASIVSEKAASAFDKNEVQLIPVQIKGVVLKTQYYVVVVKNEVECVDESKSIYKKFIPNDPIRPDKAGHYKSFDKLIIDSKLNIDYDIFRLKFCNSSIIISDKIKKKWEELGVTGTFYIPVSESIPPS